MPCDPFPVSITVNLFPDDPSINPSFRVSCPKCARILFDRASVIGDHIYLECSGCHQFTLLYYVITDCPEINKLQRI